MVQEKESSGTVTALSVIGIVFGLIGMMGSFIPCLGAFAFFIGIPAAIVSGIGLFIAQSKKCQNTFAIVALVISLIGVVISGIQYFSIISLGEHARRELERTSKVDVQPKSRPERQTTPQTRVERTDKESKPGEPIPQSLPKVAHKDIKPAGELSEAEAKELVTKYYESRGEWAGTFLIDNIEKIRIETYSPGKIFVHVKYHFKAIPGNPKGRTDSGIDQRVFNVEWKGDNYLVTYMKGYNSAIF